MNGRNRVTLSDPIDTALTGGRQTLRISIVSGIGSGQTSLSAFDDALWRCGAHNYNLIPLSSVIPPASEIALMEQHASPIDEFGYKLYVVKAEMRSTTPGAVIGAGIGWYQWGDGQGVFVEHELDSPFGPCGTVKAELLDQITSSLRDLAFRRGVEFVEERIGSRIEVTQVGVRPACALVLAIYESEGWCHQRSDNGHGDRAW